MTDTLYYPDLFTTIHIPETEKHLALEAKNLFNIAGGVEPWDAGVFAHMSKFLDTADASQIFWQFENKSDRTADRLAITAIRHALIIALERRDYAHRENEVRTTLLLSQGTPKVYVSDTRGFGRLDLGSSSEIAVVTFKQNFAETAARVGLYAQAKRLEITQSESSSAILPSAA